MANIEFASFPLNRNPIYLYGFRSSVYHLVKRGNIKEPENGLVEPEGSGKLIKIIIWNDKRANDLPNVGAPCNNFPGSGLEQYKSQCCCLESTLVPPYRLDIGQITGQQITGSTPPS